MCESDSSVHQNEWKLYIDREIISLRNLIKFISLAEILLAVLFEVEASSQASNAMVKTNYCQMVKQ